MVRKRSRLHASDPIVRLALAEVTGVFDHLIGFMIIDRLPGAGSGCDDRQLTGSDADDIAVRLVELMETEVEFTAKVRDMQRQMGDGPQPCPWVLVETDSKLAQVLKRRG